MKKAFLLHERNYDKNLEVLDEVYGKKKKMKKEAFSDLSYEELADMEEIDALTDENSSTFFEELIIETAEDEGDLLEICEAP